MEQRVIGPPGCGKTTWLGRQVKRAVDDGKEVLVASLTRAAAAEAAGRNLPIPPRNVGTLHAHCYQSLGRPSLTVDKKHVEDWNDRHPEWALSASDDRVDGDNLEESGKSPGDKLMATYQVLRARMATIYPIDVDRLATEWAEWKDEAGLMDFTDLIEQSLETIPTAPGNPSVIFLDEAQDMDLLEMSLARKWGEAAGYLVVVGDPDQNLYQWRGSDPEAFTEPPVPDDQMRVLSQSYRIPRAVHATAVRWIERTPGRTPVEYYPRDFEGEVRNLSASWPHAEMVLRDMQKYLDDGKSVMILASCAYMLRPILSQLRREGMPYHNPYRRNKGAWNPLQSSRRRITPKDLVLAFLRMSEEGIWTAEDMKKWLAATRITGVLQGNRGTLDDLSDEGSTGVSWERLHNLLTDTTIDAGLTGDLDWLRENLLAARQRGASFAIRVAEAHGAETLSKTPQIIAGTIHSVKGGEADVVYLFPDLSFAGMNEWIGGGSSAVRRLFYVGMTRSRESLILCQPASSRAVLI
jgi:DNA helicase-2/ATP-dependent DNA helicase PcrA